MYIDLNIVLIILFVIFISMAIYEIFFIKKKKEDVTLVNYFNENIMKEFEKDYKKDLNFRSKVDKIKRLILKEKIYDFSTLTKMTKTSLEECILIVKFLEYKQILPNIHVNTRNKTIIECSIEDEKLLNKYSPLLHRNHNNTSLKGEYVFNYDEFLYLYKKGLLPEIEIIEETKQILFANPDDKVRDLVSIICPSCGALNDVNRGKKGRCKYCNSLIIGPKK